MPPTQPAIMLTSAKLTSGASDSGRSFSHHSDAARLSRMPAAKRYLRLKVCQFRAPANALMAAIAATDHQAPNASASTARRANRTTTTPISDAKNVEFQYQSADNVARAWCSRSRPPRVTTRGRRPCHVGASHMIQPTPTRVNISTWYWAQPDNPTAAEPNVTRQLNATGRPQRTSGLIDLSCALESHITMHTVSTKLSQP